LEQKLNLRQPKNIGRKHSNNLCFPLPKGLLFDYQSHWQPKKMVVDNGKVSINSTIENVVTKNVMTESWQPKNVVIENVATETWQPKAMVTKIMAIKSRRFKVVVTKSCGD
jgi:hypothetical protein